MGEQHISRQGRLVMPDEECINDPTISNDEILWRYVHSNRLCTDQKTGRIKPQSGVFRDTRMSVDVASQTTLENARARNPEKYIAQVKAAYIREVGKNASQLIDPDPQNPAHATICPKLSPSEAKKISVSEDVWILAPPEPT